MSKKYGFTLTEVLITLGIIGVVAAITLPTLIASHQKRTVAIKVKKFYNIMNNALYRSVADNGDVSEWMDDIPTKSWTYEKNLEFLQQYILPYLKFSKFEKGNEERVYVYLQDGTMFSYRRDINGGDIMFFINSKYEITSRNFFSFEFNKKSIYGNKTLIEPYIFTWDGKSESLITNTTFGCNHTAARKYVFCTKWIQLNGWQIPDGYPW